MSNIEDKYGCSIKHFIEDEYSICREERQYALFLYNVLRKYHNGDKLERDTTVKNIFEACGIPTEAEIENVFYEATFMRDFFERNRRIVWGNKEIEDIENRLLQKTFSPSAFSPSENKVPNNDIRFFNAELIQYEKGTGGKLSILDPDDKKYNLAHQKIAGNELSPEQKDRIMHMMNAKPDIAVVYIENGQKKLLFLECKFESYESSYKVGNERVKQTEIHKKIAEFLCAYCGSDNMVPADPRIVKFIRKISVRPDEGEIRISDLIDINDNRIFS